MLPEIRTVAFDMDGTLLDNRAMIKKTSAILKESLNLEADVAVISDRIVKEYFRKVRAKSTEPYVLDGKVFEYSALSPLIHRIYHSSGLMADGVEEYLFALKQYGFQLVVITNGGEKGQSGKFRSSGLDQYVDCFLTSEAAGVEKPDPRIFRIAESKFNYQPQACIYFGDSPGRDIEGARNAGIKCVYVGSQTDVGADYHIASFRQITAIPDLMP